MPMVKIRLIGKSRPAVEQVLTQLQLTASVEGQQWSHQERLHEWRLDAMVMLPVESQPPASWAAWRPSLVEELDLPSYVRNQLVRCGVTTVKKLLATPEETIRSFHNIGPKGFQAIVDALQRHGLFASSALARTWFE